MPHCWKSHVTAHISEKEKTHIANDIRTLRQLLQTNQDMNDSGEVIVALNSLIEYSAHFNHLMHDFTVGGCILSQTFKFWDTIISDLSQLLLDYIAAERDFICGHIDNAILSLFQCHGRIAIDEHSHC